MNQLAQGSGPVPWGSVCPTGSAVQVALQGTGAGKARGQKGEVEGQSRALWPAALDLNPHSAPQLPLPSLSSSGSSLSAGHHSPCPASCLASALTTQLGALWRGPHPPVTWVSISRICCMSSYTGTMSLEGTGTPEGREHWTNVGGLPLSFFETAASGTLSYPRKSLNSIHRINE